MIRPRWAKVLGDFWDNKARSFLVIASIGVGVFAVGMIAVGYSVLPAGLRETYTGSNPANITLRTYPFNQELLKRIRQVDGIRMVEGRRTVSVEARAAGSSKAWEEMMLIVVEDFSDMRINLLTPASGATVPPDRTMLLLDASQPLLGVGLGDSLEIRLEDETLRNLPVSGISNDFSAGIELTFNPRVGYVTLDTLEYLHAGRFFDTLIVVVDGDGDDMQHIASVAARLIEEVEDSGRLVFSSELSGTQHDERAHGSATAPDRGDEARRRTPLADHRHVLGSGNVLRLRGMDTRHPRLRLRRSSHQHDDR